LRPSALQEADFFEPSVPLRGFDRKVAVFNKLPKDEIRARLKKARDVARVVVSVDHRRNVLTAILKAEVVSATSSVTVTAFMSAHFLALPTSSSPDCERSSSSVASSGTCTRAGGVESRRRGGRTGWPSWLGTRYVTSACSGPCGGTGGACSWCGSARPLRSIANVYGRGWLGSWRVDYCGSCRTDFLDAKPGELERTERPNRIYM
jgi:hypothetical protein